MKRLLVTALFFAFAIIPAFAANQKTFTLQEALTVGSTQLPAGDYKVTWDSNGPAVQVTFEQKGRGAAHAVATAKVQDVKDNHTGFTENQKDGVHYLETLQIGKTSFDFSAASGN